LFNGYKNDIEKDIDYEQGQQEPNGAIGEFFIYKSPQATYTQRLGVRDRQPEKIQDIR
jgi:hypothetical protein